MTEDGRCGLRAPATKDKGDGLCSANGPQLSLSSQASSRDESYCAGRANGAKCTGSARPASRSFGKRSFGKLGNATDAFAVFGGVGLMSIRRIAALQASLLLVAMLANAASLKNTMRITVLDSATRAVPVDNNGVPTNCDGITFDAYCRSTSNVPLVSTLLVQEGDKPPFRISCNIESRYSRCTPLPKGESFDARREKRGITLYYVDDKGKSRKQLYALVNAGAKASAPVAAEAVAAQ